ncbi:LuxR C-terminal-related transcriptional regulator [Actinomadura sp. 6N118]|uniref:LuxR C-terminal-related transcriptional regulator n=1 Tax=Actinomadura sp. 6N118 TaxID=3375151 RepID=UPI0037B5177A
MLTNMGDDAGAFRSSVLTLHRTTGLPVVFGGALAGPGQVRISELVGNITGVLNGLVVRQGSGLGGKAMVMGRPVWVSDYPRASSISHDYDAPVVHEGLLSVVALPIVVRRQVRGVLYGALREPIGLADRVVAAAMQTVRDLEQELAGRDAADEALARMQRETAAAPDEGPSSVTARWEQVRAVHAELRGLADQISDPALRDRLLAASTRLAAADGKPPMDGPPRLALSPRELDVLSYVAVGCTNVDAARRLGLRPDTVKSYLRSAMRKLDSHTRMEAVTAARRTGLLP